MVTSPSTAAEQDAPQILAEPHKSDQKPVAPNDVKTVGALLADDNLLVAGDGNRSTEADLLRDVWTGRAQDQHQEDSERFVAVTDDTATVTAQRWAKGIADGVKVECIP